MLWKKVMPQLSAGRVQCVATRVIVERERARMRFRAAGYWDIDATLDAPSAPTGMSTTFSATLVTLDGSRLATGKDFGEDGSLTRESAVVLDESRPARSPSG